VGAAAPEVFRAWLATIAGKPPGVTTAPFRVTATSASEHAAPRKRVRRQLRPPHLGGLILLAKTRRKSFTGGFHGRHTSISQRTSRSICFFAFPAPSGFEQFVLASTAAAEPSAIVRLLTDVDPPEWSGNQRRQP
jgi:hypothetical protein